ncbi:hypothetical protein [Micromonospora sp. NPDC005299]
MTRVTPARPPYPLLAALRAISIADLARDVDDDYGPSALAGIREWLS